MPTIELSVDQIDDPHITLEIDLTQHLNGLDINFDEQDIDELLADDPPRCFEYLLENYWGAELEKVLVEWAKGEFDSAELLSLCAKLVSDEKESAA
jgi:hypothetical protein